MTEEKIRIFVSGFVIGLVLPSLLVFLFVRYRAMPSLADLAGKQDAAMKAAEENEAKWQKLADGCLADFEELGSKVTILEEPGGGGSKDKSPLKLSLFGGLFMLEPEGDSAQAAAAVPHWIIYEKVKPRTIGPSEGFLYLYGDSETHKLEGPFVAERAP